MAGDAVTEKQPRMRIRRTILVMAEGTLSIVAANYAAWAGVPYVWLGPLKWWKCAFRWPWWVVYRVIGSEHSPQPWVVLLVLWVIYAAVGFLILNFWIARPFLRRMTSKDNFQTAELALPQPTA
jgi:hypothetical protein